MHNIPLKFYISSTSQNLAVATTTTSTITPPPENAEPKRLLRRSCGAEDGFIKKTKHASECAKSTLQETRRRVSSKTTHYFPSECTQLCGCLMYAITLPSVFIIHIKGDSLLTGTILVTPLQRHRNAAGVFPTAEMKRWQKTWEDNAAQHRRPKPDQSEDNQSQSESRSSKPFQTPAAWAPPEPECHPPLPSPSAWTLGGDTTGHKSFKAK